MQTTPLRLINDLDTLSKLANCSVDDWSVLHGVIDSLQRMATCQIPKPEHMTTRANNSYQALCGLFEEAVWEDADLLNLMGQAQIHAHYYTWTSQEIKRAAAEFLCVCCQKTQRNADARHQSGV